MPATLLTYDDFAPGVGGEFEAFAARMLRDQLPDSFTLISNVSLKRGSTSFLECDLIVAGPGICDILEMKCIRPRVRVGEDHLEGTNDFCVERVFSTLSLKSKVLRDRLKRGPFTSSCSGASVRYAIVVPDESELIFEPEARDLPVYKLSKAVEYCVARSREQSQPRPAMATELRSSWTRYRDREDGGARRSGRFLGRFQIRKALNVTPGTFTYAAFDEPPCKVDVHLKEYRFDPTLSVDQIGKYLDEVSRELRVLRRIRHPYVVSAVGHFLTGSSWVQVNDWFDGEPLERQWNGVRELSVHDKISLCSKVTEALAFCHQKGVFHRAICADNVLVNSDFDEIRVAGFELAKDLRLTSTLSAGALSVRDRRLMAPEELATGTPPNPRLADTFQLGVLFCRVFQDGVWPYDDPMEFYTSGGAGTAWHNSAVRLVPSSIVTLLEAMLSIEPARRPDPLSRVAASLAEISRAVT